jgi:hypothetical protein
VITNRSQHDSFPAIRSSRALMLAR